MKKLLLPLLTALTLATSGVAPAIAQTDYVVGAQDVLTITVYGEPDLSREYKVEQDGSLSVPLIGRVQVGGLTLRALEQELKTKLADGFLRNPQVTVTVQQYKSQQILVIGEVRAPGPYQLSGGMTLLQALALAGSTTPAAGREVLVARAPKPRTGQTSGGEETPEVVRIDLAALQAGNYSLNIAMQDGDTINVLKARSVTVSGHVKNSGAFTVEEGTTVLQVLSLAGGITDRGSEGRLLIERVEKGKRTQIKAKLTDVVQPGDIIIVRERFF